LANQTFSINVVGPYNTRWQIFDSNGNKIIDSAGLQEVKLSAAGGYTFVIYNASNYTGAYTISVQKVGG
jgi:hypothetical protein